MTWGFVAAVVAHLLVQEERGEIRKILNVCPRFLVSRNKREGRYLGREHGRHLRNGPCSHNK